MVIESRATRLRFARNQTLLSRRNFCRKHNLKYSTISLWENTKLNHGNNLSTRGAKMVVQALLKDAVTCELSWLLEGKGKAPISNITNETTAISSTKIRFEKAKKLLPWAYWQVSNNNMAPRFKAGSYIFYEQIELSDIKQNGVYLVQETTEKIQLGHLGKTQDGKYILFNNNFSKAKTIYPLSVYIPKAIIL